MKNFKSKCAALVAVTALVSSCTNGGASGGSDDRRMNAYIDSLMSEMTLAEKLGQLNLPVTGEIVTGEATSSDVAGQIREGMVGGLFNLKGVDRIRELQKIAVEESRLGIPLLFGMDVVHGYETVFPIPLAVSCTWDMEAIEKSAQIAAKEASADGICWTFSPMVDICRDARWGRIAEGSGEDPYLGSLIAAAMVRGYQGDFSSTDNILACVKHFALYGAPDGGRDYNTVDMSRWRMYNDYFPPYKAAVEAGVGTVMAAFNVVEGMPATGNKWLLTDVLREQWGFKGFVVTDYSGISEMTTHGIGDLATVSAMALNAGSDMDMVSAGYVGTLDKSLEQGLVSQKTIDHACRLILEAKYRLGLFDDPYKYCDSERRASDVFTAGNREFARKVARESFVLLKNDNSLLPLAKRGTIALVGPLADTRANMAGTWSVAANLDSCRSVLDGLRAAAGADCRVLYAKGCNLMYDAQGEADATCFGRDMRDTRSDAAMLAEALAVARSADVIVAALGEASEMTGEAASRTDLEMPDAQRDLLKALLATGKPVVLLNFSGRPTVLKWESERVPAIMQVWFGGSETGDAIADVLFGDYNPSGKLTASFPVSVGQLPLSYVQYNTGRPNDSGAFRKYSSCYLDVPNVPLYPFGFGLSYTTFDYSDITLSSTEMTPSGSVKASVTVTNSGTRDGAEVVQLYIRDLIGSVVRPLRELKGFEKIMLKAGESRQVEFEIDVDKLKFYNADLEYVYEPGEFEVMVGPDSRDVRSARFTLTENH